MEGKNEDKGFVGYEGLKKKQGEQLKKFEDWAKNRKWKEFGPTNHFDWWMFPIDAKSQHGWKYSVFSSDVETLLKDEEFLRNYRRGVELIALSWGWDINNRKPVSDPDKSQIWNGYDIRLRKCGTSLLQLKQLDYYNSLNEFVQFQKTTNKTKFDQNEMIRYNQKSTWPFQ
eukprot:TRINITY_DN23809_c0_g1_i1.p1 TRINITY_DN23809_c0_g1~~TRINITY_DN23809_c0_g1_i1.p1  ORF type:complete len:171 (+),score=30.95 TRINITY_DN23809_c0_g1_i1:179-691(+)